MRGETCELCGYQSQLVAMEKHHIVPTDITEHSGMPASQAVRLCCNCHREVHTWYPMKVRDMAYDSRAKQFRPKSGLEMVKEYQTAFNSFVKYKKEPKRQVEQS